MAHYNNVLSQLLKLVPRYEFGTLANHHHAGQNLSKMVRWPQFFAMAMAQLSGRVNLCDMVSNLSAQSAGLYHLGPNVVSLSFIAGINEQKPYLMYEKLKGKLLRHCQRTALRLGFCFNSNFYSLDASSIELCLSVFSRAKFRTTKGAVKIRVGLDRDGLLPTFLSISDGKIHDITAARTLQLRKGSILAVNRGYTDYAWNDHSNLRGIFVVTRLRKNACYRIAEWRSILESKGLNSDQTTQLAGSKASGCPLPLRRIGYKDPEPGIQYYFLNNNFKLAAATIAEIVKARWQIELFFKWIKQNQKIRSFLGTLRNVVMTQIWIAIYIYLLLAYLKFSSCLGQSLQQILRLLELNIFVRRDLQIVLCGDPPEPDIPPSQTRVLFS